jgi:hypothetical protein
MESCTIGTNGCKVLMIASVLPFFAVLIAAGQSIGFARLNPMFNPDTTNCEYAYADSEHNLNGGFI